MAVIKSGVPPDLILDSILFNIYINDLHDSTECTVISFASHTNLRGEIDKVEGKNGRLGQQKLHEVQQKEMQSPASGTD